MELSFEFEPAQEIIFTDEKLNSRERAIHDQALRCAKEYLIAEAALLRAIIEVDRAQTYKRFSMTYLTPYCVKYLGLSEDVAAIFVRVARKSQEVPELQQAVDQGLSVTKAKTIVSVLTAENQETWIEKAQTLSKDRLEREVAVASPSARRPEKATPTGENRHRIEFELGDREMALERRAQDIVSQKLRRSATLAETQRFLLEGYLKHEDPVVKADRAATRQTRKMSKPRAQMEGKSRMEAESRTEREPQAQKEPPRGRGAQSGRESALLLRSRVALPRKVEHLVHLRDRGACQARRSEGSKCLAKRWVHIHHIVPVSKGGENLPNNLITLCSNHHRLLHERTCPANLSG